MVRKLIPVAAAFFALGIPATFAGSTSDPGITPTSIHIGGTTTWGRDYRQYPWTIGYQPTYIAEGAMYGNYIRRTMPAAKIAILYQNDDYGKDLITGLKRGLGTKAGNIVARESYEATDDNVQSQVVRLRSSKA